MRFDRAIIVTVVAGYLFLPSGASMPLPGLPPYSKGFATAVALMLGWLFFRPQLPPRRDRAPGRRLVNLLSVAALGLIFATPFLTLYTNPEALEIGESFRPGLKLTDALRTVQSLLLIMPLYFLARFYLTSEESRRALLEITVMFSLAYSLLALFEVRMSPQLSNWIYGYFPHQWLQHIRGGAFRPVVFLTHALWLGFWFLTATLSAFILFRDEASPERRMFWLVSGVWLFGVLVLSRNTGALFLAVLFVPLILFSWRRLLARAAMVVAVIFMTFPALRQADLMPMDEIVALIALEMPRRARSLQTRVENEDRLLVRALEKPLYGWGGWGRARVLDEKGRDISVTDGLWTIVLGERGWLGYIGFFGLVVTPLLLLPRIARRERVKTTTLGMGLLVSTALIYSIPNAAMLPYVWLYVGALTGSIRSGSASEPVAKPPLRAVFKYSRFGSDRSRGSTPTAS